MLRRPIVTSLASLMLATLAGCGDATGPGDVTVSGTWAGSITLPNGYSASATLQQTGSAVSGTMRVSGAFVQGLPITGDVAAANRTFTWLVARGCEVWGGVLNVDAGGATMSGPVTINRVGCQPAQSNGSGQLSLTRQ